ncbi:imidazolonepropionase (plasmid) [Haloterrigena turkmenica DSM 5511]|uniref:Imidazolonepropionase n=1 Tax=Haloterrigena turkmenica (strain ATCC 51198 / DSM 5511 / JCM 9101 / NCIMB 13204 / VKM B-1734 / 4k) TaxID=543526 RepID=D2S0I4_HALTV|nr:imidazolonepropionase [Haloterrigena turkmenica]ADB62881.1 imidazolonepropionase [Haloterrigena turkmenica DSM 5511]
MTDLVVHNAAQVTTPTDDGGMMTTQDGAVAIEDGVIVAVGPTDEVTREYPEENATDAVDAAGKTVLPGFVDPHTHAVFAGDRADEFTAKLKGAEYQDILEEGGGILRTVRATREASRDRLVESLLARLDVMLAHGTTTVEVKSGYGLDVETEMKMLEAIGEAADRHPIDVVPTFMGAHAVPDDTDTDAYIDRVVEEQLPAVTANDLAEFCDIFCEAGVFSVDHSRRVLEAGQEHGLKPKIHADEFERLGGSQLAADIGATSADHLLQSTEADITALGEANVTPVLLPGTAFSLATDYADATAFEAADVPVAIATDFNPNCYSQSMEFAIELACNGMRMSPASAIRSATVTAANAIDRTDGTGILRENSPGDLIVADVPDYQHLPYNFGVQNVQTVVKRGEVVRHD